MFVVVALLLLLLTAAEEPPPSFEQPLAAMPADVRVSRTCGPLRRQGHRCIGACEPRGRVAIGEGALWRLGMMLLCVPALELEEAGGSLLWGVDGRLGLRLVVEGCGFSQDGDGGSRGVFWVGRRSHALASCLEAIRERDR